jgi:hypothetical protein
MDSCRNLFILRIKLINLKENRFNMIAKNKEISLSGSVVGYVAHITPMSATTIYTDGKKYFNRYSSGLTDMIKGDVQLILSKTKECRNILS